MRVSESTWLTKKVLEVFTGSMYPILKWSNRYVIFTLKAYPAQLQKLQNILILPSISHTRVVILGDLSGLLNTK